MSLDVDGCETGRFETLETFDTDDGVTNCETSAAPLIRVGMLDVTLFLAEAFAPPLIRLLATPPVL